MKPLILVAIVALAGTAARAVQQAPPVRDAIVQPTVGTASISGQVVNDEEQPKPVRRAIVTLTGSDLRPSRGAITDDEGRFTFANLPAGRVTLTVTRASFITSVYGAKRPGKPGTPISLGAGEAVSGLVVKAWRGAVIAGILRDDTGAPVAGIPVSVMASRTNGTPAVLSLSNNPATTDDLGEFRIFGLPPGTYVISATPSAGGGGAMRAMTDAEVDAAFEAVRRRASSGSGAGSAATAKEPEPDLPRPFAYAPIYFPGTPILSEASVITLVPGQEQTGLEFALQRVPTAVVEGVVSRSDGQPPAGTTVQMTGVAPPGPFATDSPLVLQATAGANGVFQILQVPPGDYTLVARSGSGAATLWGSGSVSVGGADVSGVAIAVEPGATISGRVRFESATAKPPADLTRIRVTLAPAEVLALKPGTPIRTLVFTGFVPLRADGSFEVVGVPPGSFALTFNPIDAAAWWGRSAVLEERDLFDGLIDVGRASMTDVVVTFTDKRSELSGSLQTSSGAPASDVFVIAYATNPAMWGPRARRVQAVRPGVDGRFSIKDLPPGDYYLSAVTDVEQEELQEPKFLEELVKASIKISIGEGEKKVQDLRMGGVS
jgi:uncharacterized protein (DUF2141 family)